MTSVGRLGDHLPLPDRAVGTRGLPPKRPTRIRTLVGPPLESSTPPANDLGSDTPTDQCSVHRQPWSFVRNRGGWCCTAPAETPIGQCDSRPVKAWVKWHPDPGTLIPGAPIPRPDPEPEEADTTVSVPVPSVPDPECIWRPDPGWIDDLARWVKPKDMWRHLPERCWTCGAPPVGRYPDGSPLYRCPTGPHGPVTGHPEGVRTAGGETEP
jgi:hypothetical protein